MATDSSSNASLIDAIYDAALDARAWPAVLDRVCDATQSVGAMLISMDLRQPAASRVVFARLDPSLMQRYLSHHAALDPWTAAATKLPAGGVFALDEWVPQSALLRSALYAEILRGKDIRHAATSILRRDAECVAAISVYRSGRTGAYEGKVRELLAALAPHVERAQNIGARLGDAAAIQGSMVAALDALAQGVALLDARGRLLFANRRAEAMFSRGSGLCLRGGRLSGTSAAEAARLHALLTLAARGGGGSMHIGRAAGRWPCLLEAVGAGRSRSAVVCPAAAVLVLFTDLEPRLGADAAALSRWFGLTRAEARVAAAIASGDGVPQLARALGVSANTVHTHLRRVFAKLGVRSQAGLVSVLHRASTVNAGMPASAEEVCHRPRSAP